MIVADEKRQLKTLLNALSIYKAEDNANLLLKFRKELSKLLKAGHRLSPSLEMTRELGMKFDSVYIYCREPVEHLIPKFQSLMYITGLMCVIMSCNEELFDKDFIEAIQNLHGSHGLAISASLNYPIDSEVGQEARYHLEEYMTIFQNRYIQKYEKILENQRKRH